MAHRRLKRFAVVLPLLLSAIGLSGCDEKKSPAPPATLDYGILGKPDPSEYTDFDPDIAKRSPAADLALFRKNELNPPHGTEDRPMNWDAIDEHEDYQRALFYSAAERSPDLITPRDLGWVRTEEKNLVESACDNAGSPGNRYQLSGKDCISRR